MQREQERTMGARQPIGVISIGSNDIHLLVQGFSQMARKTHVE
jgi:hypothetical protein